LRLLRELVVKGFENFPLNAGMPCCKAVSAMADNEVKTEVENHSTEITDIQGPELPIPVPDLLQATT